MKMNNVPHMHAARKRKAPTISLYKAQSVFHEAPPKSLPHYLGIAHHALNLRAPGEGGNFHLRHFPHGHFPSGACSTRALSTRSIFHLGRFPPGACSTHSVEKGVENGPGGKCPGWKRKAPGWKMPWADSARVQIPLLHGLLCWSQPRTHCPGLTAPGLTAPRTHCSSTDFQDSLPS